MFKSSSQPVVVQGEAVDAKVYSHGEVQNYNRTAEYGGHATEVQNYNQTAEYGGQVAEVPTGKLQPKRCNDPVWAFLFFAQLTFMSYLAAVNGHNVTDAVAEGYGDRMLMTTEDVRYDHTMSSYIMRAVAGVFSAIGNSNGMSRRLDEAAEYTPANVVFLVGTTSLAGLVLSSLSLSFMMKFAETLIKVGLWFNILTGLLMGILGAISGQIGLAIMGFLLFAFAAWYAYHVWARIPFAASNLVTAVTAVKANIGVALFAYVSVVFMILWMGLWSVSAGATMYVLGDCNADGECQNKVNGFIVFLFLVSLFWTFEVIKNVVHVTVAGTVGTWWWKPEEATSCCSAGVRNSFFRAITYSFGSICLGSLLVAILKAIRETLRRVREQDDGILLCIADCLLGCLEAILEYFNEWAYVYVGLYGYTFVEAAKNVIQLFKARGWTTIITDGMINNVLSMISVGVGLITGLIGILIASAQGAGLQIPGMIIGFIVGFFLTLLLMGTVGSAVNTVIVCYAEDPNIFEAHHPELSGRMRDTWRQAWPAEFKY